MKVLLWVQRCFGLREDLNGVGLDAVRAIFLAVDWRGEWKTFQDATTRAAECTYPEMGVADDAGHELRIYPVDEEAFGFLYDYSVFRSQFGFSPMEQPRKHRGTCGKEEVPALFQLFFDGKEDELLARPGENTGASDDPPEAGAE